jgi:hypothetical protein
MPPLEVMEKVQLPLPPALAKPVARLATTRAYGALRDLISKIARTDLRDQNQEAIQDGFFDWPGTRDGDVCGFTDL